MTGPIPRASVAAMTGYTPGEQPKTADLIKLNTNENPYPPSPAVMEALANLDPNAARKYPPPMADALREAIARDLTIRPEQILITNGSDEILRLAVEAYVEPGERVGYLWPTYSLYPVFVAKAGAEEVRLGWNVGGRTQEEALLNAPKDLKVLFITNPNPPVGLEVSVEIIRRVAEQLPQTLIVVDEAYIAYGGESSVPLLHEELANILVTRSFSKSHSLAGLRVGLGAGSPGVMDVLFRIKDSYNVSAAGLAAGLAAWNDVEYTEQIIGRIRSTRAKLTSELHDLGFSVPASSGNFVFARGGDAPALFKELRNNRILVRYFDTPELRDGMRITVGTLAEVTALIELLRGPIVGLPDPPTQPDAQPVEQTL
ncbi:histidinol-phosphate transaminase [bacterium]|nr:histidinol-phosphate transaminase [bacterium]